MAIKIKIKHNSNLIEGILINETSESLTIKLNSGYNGNYNKINIEEISRIEINDEKKSFKLKKKNPISNLPKISIIHTGGTIASKVNYKTGGVSSKFTIEELLSLFPELNNKASISAKMIGNLFSEDMRFEEYNLLLEEIKKEIKNGSKGIIIGHGTDTLHYTSSALQYAIKNLPIPIILVGAQRSSDRPSSDAFSNLNSAVEFILSQKESNEKFLRVGICMHDSISDNSFQILDGINCKKMHSTRRDAFKQINYKPFAIIKDSKIKILRKDLLSTNPINKFSFQKFNTELKIGFFKSHPNTFSFEIDLLSNYDAVIVEGTGIGNIPANENNLKKDNKILNSFKNLSKKTKIISSIQTISGEVSLDIYSRGKEIQKSGFIGNRTNLISETLFSRVAYCLSQKEKSFENIWNENLESFKIRDIQL